MVEGKEKRAIRDGTAYRDEFGCGFSAQPGMAVPQEKGALPAVGRLRPQSELCAFLPGGQVLFLLGG